MSDDFAPKAFSVDDVNRTLSPTLTPGKAARNSSRFLTTQA
jgi:hypothetical protein